MVENLRANYVRHHARGFARLGLVLAMALLACGPAYAQTLELSLLKNFFPYTINHPTNIDGTLYFFVAHGDRNELWKSDGTPAGTVMIKFFSPDDSLVFIDHQFVRFRNEIYFSANDFVHGTELWKTDGTPGGTVLVMDLLPGPMGAHPEIQEHCVTADCFYFSAMKNTTRRMSQLWKTDGTTAGTTMISDAPYEGTRLKTVVDNKIFFSSREIDDSYWLWDSDGTSTGTIKLKEVNYWTFPGMGMKGQFYFGSGGGLWKSDGSAVGTMLVKSPMSDLMGEYNGNLYMTGSSTDGFGLWKSNGTAAGTIMLKDFTEGYWRDPDRKLCNFRGKMYFATEESSKIQRLWQSDGTAAGTVMVSDFPISSFGTTIIPWLDHMYLFSSGSIDALWKSDGTAAGTIQAGVLPDGITSSNSTWIPCGQNLFFTVSNNDGSIDLMVNRAKQTVPVEFSGFSAN